MLCVVAVIERQNCVLKTIKVANNEIKHFYCLGGW